MPWGPQRFVQELVGALEESLGCEQRRPEKLRFGPGARRPMKSKHIAREGTARAEAGKAEPHACSVAAAGWGGQRARVRLRGRQGLQSCPILHSPE